MVPLFVGGFVIMSDTPLSLRLSLLALLLLPVIFIGWRLFRITRAQGLRAGRSFERVGRYKLAREYRDSEHAAMVAYRRRKARAAEKSQKVVGSHSRRALNPKIPKGLRPKPLDPRLRR